MILRSTIALAATILFGALFGIAGARAQASLAVPGVVIERPPAVQDLIARLKTARPFAELEDKPNSCWEFQNGGRISCRYLPKDLRVTVVWNRLNLHPDTVFIEKSEPLAATPFAWADLATSFHLLCPWLTAEQAAAMAGEATDKLPERWLKCGSITTCVFVARETDGAGRVASSRGRSCHLQLSESIKDGAVRSKVSVSILETKPPRPAPGR